MAKNSKKCKNSKNVQVRIDPYSSPMMLMIISDGKIGDNELERRVTDILTNRFVHIRNPVGPEVETV